MPQRIYVFNDYDHSPAGFFIFPFVSGSRAPADREDNHSADRHFKSPFVMTTPSNNAANPDSATPFTAAYAEPKKIINPQHDPEPLCVNVLISAARIRLTLIFFVVFISR